MSEVRLLGMDKLMNAFDRKIKNVKPSAMKTVVRQNTSEMQRTAKKNCPVDTGNLKRSITMEFENGGLTGIVRPYMDYAAYVELGTRFMKAQPYMWPALQHQSEIFAEDLKKLVKE